MSSVGTQDISSVPTEAMWGCGNRRHLSSVVTEGRCLLLESIQDQSTPSFNLPRREMSSVGTEDISSVATEEIFSVRKKTSLFRDKRKNKTFFCGNRRALFCGNRRELSSVGTRFFSSINFFDF